MPPTARIHPVFHVSQLKLVVGDQPTEENLPEELQLPTAKFIPDYQTETIAGQSTEQVLIQRKHQPTEDATWKDLAAITTVFRHQP